MRWDRKAVFGLDICLTTLLDHPWKLPKWGPKNSYSWSPTGDHPRITRGYKDPSAAQWSCYSLVWRFRQPTRRARDTTEWFPDTAWARKDHTTTRWRCCLESKCLEQLGKEPVWGARLLLLPLCRHSKIMVNGWDMGALASMEGRDKDYGVTLLELILLLSFKLPVCIIDKDEDARPPTDFC